MSKKRIILFVFIFILIFSFFFYRGKFSRKIYQPDAGDLDFEEFIPSDQFILKNLSADTNGDDLEEIHVLAQDKNSHHFIYIFDQNGKALYDDEILVEPSDIELRNFQNYDYPSLFLKYKNSFKEGFFISWDGLEYIQKIGEE